MKTSIVVIARDRPALTQQTLRTLWENTDQSACTVVVVNDGSNSTTTKIVEERCNNLGRPSWTALHLLKPLGIVGALRNLGASLSEKYFGRGEYLCFLDNDVYLLPRWLERMSESMQRESSVKVLGGQRHPYHGVNRYWGVDRHVEETDAVAGYSLLMRWSTWQQFGPFASNQQGVGASEDFDFCQRIKKWHERFQFCPNCGSALVNNSCSACALGFEPKVVGYVNPPVLYHCGITNTNGQPATGADQFPRVPGVLYA